MSSNSSEYLPSAQPHQALDEIESSGFSDDIKPQQSNDEFTILYEGGNKETTRSPTQRPFCDTRDLAGQDLRNGPHSVHVRRIIAESRPIAESLNVTLVPTLGQELYRSFRGKEISGKGGAHFRSWTAWPLPPDIVPRGEKSSSKQANVLPPFPFIAISEKPSQDMEDCLLACCLRLGKENFQKRRQEDAAPLSNVDVSADDARSALILKPSINHVLSRLNAMLQALHHLRKSYLSFNSPKEKKIPRKRGRSRISEDESGNKMVAPARRRRPGLSISSDSDDSERPPKRMRKTSSAVDPFDKLLRRRRNLGLRDWTDVLGLARIYDLDHAAVTRTMARCLLMFGEAEVLELLDK